MIVCNPSEKQIEESIKIAEELKEWFTPEAIKNMRIDFEKNSLIVNTDKGKVDGFLCYTTYSGKTLLIWMGIARKAHRKGIGNRLLKWLEQETKKLNLYSIEVETLPDEIKYEPYNQTRNFYYKNGFERVFYKKARIKGWDDQIILEKKV